MHPVISILMPAHNAEAYIAETIRSVLAQTEGAWELVVVDDGSTDATAELVRQFSLRDERIRLISQAKSGVSAARNRALADVRETSEYVAFLDADDLWPNDALETLRSALDRRPEYVAAHGLGQYVDEQGELFRGTELEMRGRNRKGIAAGRLVPWSIDRPTSFETLCFRNCILVGAILIRRAAVIQLRGFDPELSHFEDWDLWIRLSQLADIAFVDRVVFYYRQHGQNATRLHQSMDEGWKAVATKLLRSPELSQGQRRIVHIGLQHFAKTMIEERLTWAKESWRDRDFLGALKQLRHALKSLGRYLGGFFA